MYYSYYAKINSFVNSMADFPLWCQADVEESADHIGLLFTGECMWISRGEARRSVMVGGDGRAYA